MEGYFPQAATLSTLARVIYMESLALKGEIFPSCKVMKHFYFVSLLKYIFYFLVLSKMHITTL